MSAVAPEAASRPRSKISVKGFLATVAYPIKSMRTGEFLLHERGQFGRQDGRHQKAMAVQPVQVEPVADPTNGGHVVRKGGAVAGTGAEDLPIGKRRMQGVGGREQLHHCTRRNASHARGLHHRRTDHVSTGTARHDVAREARVEEADRTAQRHAGSQYLEHLTPHSTQVAQPVRGGEAPTIDDAVASSVRSEPDPPRD